MASINIQSHEENTRHRCQNCEREWPTRDLRPIEDFELRVAAGEPCPSGECRDCGALCQPLSAGEEAESDSWMEAQKERY